MNVSRLGFTLIELLVAMTIFGLLSTTIATSVQEATYKANGAYELLLGNAVRRAFELRALDDNLTTWWPENNFPRGAGWGAYIQDLVDDDFLTEFLPIIPDESNYGGTNSLPYAYDNDGDTFSNPSDCYSTSNQGRSFRGVNFVYNLGINSSSDRWNEIVSYLDEAIDGTDGPFCGHLRYALTGNAGARGQIIYAIDFDQVPNF